MKSKKPPVLKAEKVKGSVFFIEGYELEKFIKKVYKKSIDLREDQDFKPVVRVNLPATPEKLAKSELLYDQRLLARFMETGHERGCYGYMQVLLKDCVARGLIEPGTYVVEVHDD